MSAPMDEAGEWLLRLTEEQVSPADIEAWRHWLAASPANQAAFERVQAVWGLAGRVSDPPWPTDREVALDEKRADMPRPVPRARRLYRFAAALGMLALGAALYWRLIHDPAAPVFATDIAESRSFTLADGSRLTLGGASRVRVAFTPQRRSLELEAGEAFFDVEKDPSRPFDVSAGDTRVIAVGTSFTVRRAADRVQVAVMSGVVRVVPAAQGAEELRLGAGTQTVVQPGTTAAPAPAAEPIAAARRDGQLRYSAEPLRYVVADLNRYSRVPIEIASPNAGDLLITGTVLERDLEGWLAGLEKALPVQVSFDEERIAIR